IKSIQENKAARVGEVYEGVVISVGKFGVWVKFNGDEEGLLPFSELPSEQFARLM
ncbi:hypothetical protein MKW94_004098, partial [Papaver nudicaule]|nr:hypothetical protein [Papaver nudicaule]MCL7051691.1 hypothetical protein [Papaver nudicaule]